MLRGNRRPLLAALTCALALLACQDPPPTGAQPPAKGGPAPRSEVEQLDLDAELFAAAIKKKDPAAVKEAIRKGASPDARDLYDGETVLHQAVRFALDEVARELVRDGANPNLRTQDRGNPKYPNSVYLSPLELARATHAATTNPALADFMQKYVKSSAPTTAPSPPPWFALFRRAAVSLGRTKEQAFAVLGVPFWSARAPVADGPEALFYAYIHVVPRQMKFFDRENDNYVYLRFDDGDPQRCVSATCTFARKDQDGHPDARLPAGEIWRQVGAKEATPSIRDRGVQFGTQGETPLCLMGTLKGGQPFVLYAVTAVDRFTYRTEFSVKTDRHEVVETKPNPRFRWQDCPVSRILVFPAGSKIPEQTFASRFP